MNINKVMKKVFVCYKGEDKSVLVYPYKQTAWQMDKFILGMKVSKVCPHWAQSIKVLSLLDLPFFFDPIENKLVMLNEKLSDFDEIFKIVSDYFNKVDNPSISKYLFKNDSKLDYEKLNSLL